MDHNSASANGNRNAYVPYRYYSPSDCINPSGSTPGDCSETSRIRYEIQTYDISGSASPAGTDPNRAGNFPLCVIQPDS